MIIMRELGYKLTMAGCLIGAGLCTLAASEAYKLEKNLEPSAARNRFGSSFFYADRDHNDKSETYFRDTETGKEYRVERNPQTMELSFELVR